MTSHEVERAANEQRLASLVIAMPIEACERIDAVLFAHAVAIESIRAGIDRRTNERG